MNKFRESRVSIIRHGMFIMSIAVIAKLSPDETERLMLDTLQDLFDEEFEKIWRAGAETALKGEAMLEEALKNGERK